MKQNSKKLFFYSIKVKVALLCTCSIILAVAINAAYLINVCKDTITRNTEVTMQDLAASYSGNLSEVIRQISESANFMMSSKAISAYVDSEGTEGSEEIENLVTMFLRANTSHEDISLTDKNGIILYSSNSSLIGRDLSKEEYFTCMIESGLAAQGNVSSSDSSSDAVITFAIPLRTDMQVEGSASPFAPAMEGSIIPAPNAAKMRNQSMPVEEFTGALITSVHVSQFGSLLSDISIADYKTGYAFIVDATGTYIYHPDEALIGTKAEAPEIQSAVTDTQSSEEATHNIITFQENGVTKYAGYSIISDNHWALFIAADQSEILSTLNSVSENSIKVSLLLTLLLTLIAYLAAGKITKSIRRITRLIHKTAELDLTETVSMDTLTLSKDETGEMGRAIYQMRTSLNEMLQRISQISGEINKSSENLSQISYSVNEHTSDNSATAEELSASMEETAATTEQIHDSIEQIGGSSREITERAALGTSLSFEIIKRAEQLKTATELSTLAARKVYEEVRERTDAALEQSKAVQKINLLTSTIKNIAEQTNLLSLNASIEAARAGEAGAGFAVVASEIGSLAQQSSAAVHNITETVEEVYQAVGTMARSMEQTLHFLEQNVLVNYNDFLTSSEKYHSDARLMSSTMDSIHQQIELLNANLMGISNSISEINLMVGEASKGVNDVAVKNSNIVALTNRTQTMAKDNTDHAGGLKSIVNQFRL